MSDWEERASYSSSFTLYNFWKKEEVVTNKDTDWLKRAIDGEREDRGVRTKPYLSSFLSLPTWSSYDENANVHVSFFFFFLYSLISFFHRFYSFYNFLLLNRNSKKRQNWSVFSREQLHPHKCSNISCLKSFLSAHSLHPQLLSPSLFLLSQICLETNFSWSIILKPTSGIQHHHRLQQQIFSFFISCPKLLFQQSSILSITLTFLRRWSERDPLEAEWWWETIVW